MHWRPHPPGGASSRRAQQVRVVLEPLEELVKSLEASPSHRVSLGSNLDHLLSDADDPARPAARETSKYIPIVK